MKASKAKKVREAVEQIIRQNGQIGPEDIMGLCSEFHITEHEFYELDEPEPKHPVLIVVNDEERSMINSLRLLRATRAACAEFKRVNKLSPEEQNKYWDETMNMLEKEFTHQLTAVDDYLKYVEPVAVDKKEVERQRKLTRRHRKQKRGK